LRGQRVSIVHEVAVGERIADHEESEFAGVFVARKIRSAIAKIIDADVMRELPKSPVNDRLIRRQETWNRMQFRVRDCEDAVAGGQLKQPKTPLGQSRRADETQSDAHSRKRERAPPPRPLIEHSLQRLGRSLSQSSSRCSWSRPIRWWRGCRTPMAPR